MSLRSEVKNPPRRTEEIEPNNDEARGLAVYQQTELDVLANGITPERIFDNGRLILACGSGNIELSRAIARHFQQEYGTVLLQETMEPINEHIFADGERAPRYTTPLRNKVVYLIQAPTPTIRTQSGEVDPYSGINDQIVELMLMINAAKKASAQEVNVVLPYAPYLRQDRKTRSGEPMSASWFLQAIEDAGADSIFVLDPHSKQISGSVRIPFDIVHASYVFKQYIENLIGDTTNLICLSPDTGGVKMTDNYAQVLTNCGIQTMIGLGVIAKLRNPSTGLTQSSPPIGITPGCDVLIIDDIAASCGTLISAAKLAKEAGAKRVFAAVVHGLFTGDALTKLHQYPDLELVLTTNSIRHRPQIIQESQQEDGKIRIIDLAPFLADVIYCLYTGKPLDQFFLDKNGITHEV